MLKDAFNIGILVVMNNHMYTFEGCIHGQQSGGPINLELTGVTVKINSPKF